MEIRWGTKPRIAKALAFATSHTLELRSCERALCVCVHVVFVYFHVCIFVETLSRLCHDKSIFRQKFVSIRAGFREKINSIYIHVTKDTYENTSVPCCLFLVRIVYNLIHRLVENIDGIEFFG